MYEEQREVSSDEDDILYTLDGTCKEDQKSVNEASSFNELIKQSKVKTLLQAIIGIL